MPAAPRRRGEAVGARERAPAWAGRSLRAAGSQSRLPPGVPLRKRGAVGGPLGPSALFYLIG